jgi:hypothetical protein
MGSYLSNNVITDMTLDFVLLPVLDAVTQVISWLYSVVDVVDKCLDSMPRGPAGSSHGDFAEVEFSVNNSSETPISADNLQLQQSLGSRIRNSLKLVELATMRKDCASRAIIREQGDCFEDINKDGKILDKNLSEHHVLCAVCLADVREDEKVYELTQCNHIFHSLCLDRWVGHNHYTCPLCRTALLKGTSSNSNSARGTITTLEDDGGMEEVDPGFSLGIWFVSRCAVNGYFYGSSWTRSMMRLAGF